MQAILDALSTLRIPPIIDEHALHRLIAEALCAHGIEYTYEARIAPRCRVDFLCEGGVALEVKRGKPPTRALMEQLRRYSACEAVTALVLIVERNAGAPSVINGKPCVLFGLNRLWGVAL